MKTWQDVIFITYLVSSFILGSWFYFVVPTEYFLGEYDNPEWLCESGCPKEYMCDNWEYVGWTNWTHWAYNQTTDEYEMVTELVEAWRGVGCTYHSRCCVRLYY